MKRGTLSSERLGQHQVGAIDPNRPRLVGRASRQEYSVIPKEERDFAIKARITRVTMRALNSLWEIPLPLWRDRNDRLRNFIADWFEFVIIRHFSRTSR